MASDFRILRSLFLLLTIAQLIQAFYVPGFSIKSYRDGDTIPLFVNKIYSDNTQLQYAYSELPFVCPAHGRRHANTNLISGSRISLNLGEILRGDRITVSDYELTMGKDEEIKYLCTQKVDRQGLKWAQEVIASGYVAEWIVDNLPGATQFVTVDRTRKYYAAGFKLGYEEPQSNSDKPKHFINNHVTLVIRWHKAPGNDGQHGRKVIVGFEVYPKSVELGNRDKNMLPKDIHDPEWGLELTMKQNITSRGPRYADSTYGLQEDDELDLDQGATVTIPYTYSVYFREEEDVEWSNRWDLYFVNQEDSSSIHWLAIVNSLVIAGLLGAVVAVILGRTIRSDIKGHREGSMEEGKLKAKRARPTRSPRKSMEKTNGLLEPLADVTLSTEDASDDEPIEEMTDWKLVHADVFRTPKFGFVLAPLIGSGMQLIFMAAGVLLLSCMGILNPSWRGGFVSVGIGLFIFAGLISGYFSARVFKTFGGQMWKKNVIVTASLFPGLLFSTIFILNLFVWAQASSTALPFTTLLAIIALWLLIQLPLVHLGSWFGFNVAGAYEHPIKASAIPRQIPPRNPWWAHGSLQSVLLVGLIPFAVIFIELLFVFKSVWQDKSGYYYVFGFLAVVGVVLVVTVIEVTIVSTYLLLCHENHHWWWNAFLTGSASSFWVFAYCIYYYATKLHIEGFVSSLLFFSYSFLACAVYGLAMGTIGFMSAWVFVRRIYGAIKVD